MPTICCALLSDRGSVGSRRAGLTLAADRRSDYRPDPPMYETQTIAAQALSELLDDPDRDDWDELLAANRALIKAIVTGKPMTRKNARIVAEYLREAGWRDRAIGAATRALEFNRFLAEPLVSP
jgi:hypothetical protein